MVKRLLDCGLTTEANVRDTFQDANPELFEAIQENEKALDLKYTKGSQPKEVISNFVTIMENDERYA